MNSELLQSMASRLQQSSNISAIEKRKERQEIQSQLHSIELNFQQRKHRQAQEIDLIKTTLNDLEDLCDQTSKANSTKTAKQEESLRILKENIETHLENQLKQHQNRIQLLLETQQEKAQAFSEESRRKSQLQTSRNEEMLTQLSRKLLNLQKDFKEESEFRKENSVKIAHNIEEEIEKFKEVIESQKQRRKSSEHKIYAMLQDIEDKIKGEVDQQSLKRKKNSQSILKLIEIACSKMEENMLI